MVIFFLQFPLRNLRNIPGLYVKFIKGSFSSNVWINVGSHVYILYSNPAISVVSGGMLCYVGGDLGGIDPPGRVRRSLLWVQTGEAQACSKFVLIETCTRMLHGGQLLAQFLDSIQGKVGYPCLGMGLGKNTLVQKPKP